MNKKKEAPADKVGGGNCFNNNYTNIIPPNQTNDFMYKNLLDSGIPKETIVRGVETGYFRSTDRGYDIVYPILLEDKKSDYKAERLKVPVGNMKYSRPSGEPSRMFRPFNLSPQCLLNRDNYIIL